MNLKTLLVAATMVGLAACGSEESAKKGSASGNSPFVGQWSGTWSSPALGQTGTSTLTIGLDGSATGTTHSNQTGANGAIAGWVADGGSFSGTSQYTGEPAFKLTGTLVLSGGGSTLVGNMMQVIGGASYAGTFTYQKQ